MSVVVAQFCTFFCGESAENEVGKCSEDADPGIDASDMMSLQNDSTLFDTFVCNPTAPLKDC